jgi:ankyrin repeat protein
MVADLDPKEGRTMNAGKRSCWTAILTLVAAWLFGGMVPTGLVQAQLPPSATELHRAADRGDVAAVQALLAVGADVNVRDYFNQTPLHYAAAAGHKDVAELLLASGADVDVVDRWAETPLYYAVDGGYKDVVELLLTRGAGIHMKDTRGRTPLHAAISYDNDEIVEMLIAKGANVNAEDPAGMTPLHYAAQSACRAIAALLLAHGANVNAPTWDLRTPLHCAAAIGHLPLVRLFLDAGADLNVQDQSGKTPVGLAVSRGYEDAARSLLALGADYTLDLAAYLDDLEKARSLLDSGANPNWRGASGSLPLYVAIRQGNAPIVRLLIERGASPAMLVDSSGYTALHQAATYGYSEVIQVLIDAGADVNAKTKYGSTPATIAVSYAYDEVARRLIQAGASVTLVEAISAGAVEKVRELAAAGGDLAAKTGSWNEKTFLHVAAQRGHKEVAEFLLAQGADVNVRTNKVTAWGDVREGGRTPLHFAAAGGHTEVAELLIAKGADVDVQDVWGGRPLHDAVDNGHRDMAQLLLDHGADVNAKVEDWASWPAHRECDWTPLHYAAGMGYDAVVELLLARGAEVNARDPYGQTPLYEAAFYGYTPVVQRLMAAGADVQAKTTTGETALQRALTMDFVDIVALLGGDPNDPALGQGGPRPVVVRQAREVWKFLRWEGVDFDEIWIPEQIDFRGLEASLRKYVARARSDPTDGVTAPSSLLTDFNSYTRQYSGFVRSGVPYIVCCLYSFSRGSSYVSVGPSEDRFPLVLDGGCGIVIVVFEADSETVVHIHCHGMA